MCRILSNTERILEKLTEQSNSASLQPVIDDDLNKRKIRQFNSIRQFLNPTMVALLRMEMFGDATYTYRPDEKKLSKELFALSLVVYEHMRKEWMFTLPSKECLEEWNDEDELI